MARRNDPLGALLFTVGLLGVAVLVDRSINPIAGISGSPDEVKLQREKIREWAKIHLVGKSFYCPSLPGKDKYIFFSKAGIKHGTGRHTGDPILEFAALQEMPSILIHATYTELLESKYSVHEVAHRLRGSFFHAGHKYKVWILVREAKDGTKYYDHGIIK